MPTVIVQSQPQTTHPSTPETMRQSPDPGNNEVGRVTATKHNVDTLLVICSREAKGEGYGWR